MDRSWNATARRTPSAEGNDPGVFVVEGRARWVVRSSSISGAATPEISEGTRTSVDAQDAPGEAAVLEAHGTRLPVGGALRRALVRRLPLLVHAVVEVEEAQAALGALRRLEHLAPARGVRSEAQEAARAHDDEVRRGIGDGHRVLQRARTEPDRRAGRVAVADVRKAVHRERHHLAGAKAGTGGVRGDARGDPRDREPSSASSPSSRSARRAREPPPDEKRSEGGKGGYVGGRRVRT